MPVPVPASEPGPLETPLSPSLEGSYLLEEIQVKSTASDNREALGFADWILFIAGAAVVVELVTHRHGFAAGPRRTAAFSLLPLLK